MKKVSPKTAGAPPRATGQDSSEPDLPDRLRSLSYLLPDALRFLSDLLPVMTTHGEREPFPEVLPIDDMHDALRREFPLAPERAVAAADMAILALQFMNTLDLPALISGNIRFATQAARHLGVTWLRLLARHRPDQSGELFTDIFRGGGPDMEKEIYERLREAAERLYKYKDKGEKPVRFIHVSCALLKYKNHFLLRNREMSCSDPENEVNGRWVLPGGRLDFEDMPEDDDLPREKRIRLLAATDDLGPWADQAHLKGLERELKEELGIEKHMYAPDMIKQFKPFLGCYGDSLRHSFTSTSMRLYRLKLNLASAGRLNKFFRKEMSDHWVTAETLLRPSAETGIFFEAGRDNLTEEELKAEPDSFQFLPGDPAGPKNNIVFHWRDTDTRLVVFKEKGKGRPSPKTIRLEAPQVELLAALGLAKRSFAAPFEEPTALQPKFPAEGLEPVLGGLIIKDPELKKCLAALPKEAACHVAHDRDYYILSAGAFFQPDFFYYQLEPGGEQGRGAGLLKVVREEIKLERLGVVYPGQTCRLELAQEAWNFVNKKKAGGYDTWRKAKDSQTGFSCADCLKDLGLLTFCEDVGGEAKFLIKPR